MNTVAERPQVNEAFLREVLAFIELHPELWDQNDWMRETPCGTTYCLAGWACVLADNPVMDSATRRVDIPVEATRLLGLTGQQAWELFGFAYVHEVGRYARHPTFDEFCGKVERVTGVRFKPTPVAVE